MTKSIIVAIATLSLGAIAGTIVTQGRLGGEMEQLRSEHRESMRRANEAEESLASVERRAERLAQQNNHLEDRLNRLHATLDDGQGSSGAAGAQDGGGPTDWEAFAGVDDAPMERPGREDGPQREAAMDWRQQMAEDRADDVRMSEEEREERREARRQEWEDRMNDMREDMRSRMNEAIQTADDPESRDRMTAVAEYSEYIMELREQMRGAEDATRDELMTEMRDAGREVRNLIEEQQQHNVLRVAEQYGITDEAEARALVESLNEAQSTDLFGGGRGGAGIPGLGGRGGPGGGRGGR